jgi:hypothetical protein
MSKAIGAVTGATGIGKQAQQNYDAAGRAAQYKPWDVTGSWFGDASFDHEENTSEVNLSPEMIQLRDLFMNKALEGVDENAIAQGEMFKETGLDMFTEARDRDISKVGSDYYNDLQELMAPGRAKSQQGLANNLFASGRMGQGTAAHEGGGYLNPERMEYLTAMNREDNRLGVESMSRARNERYEDMAKGLGYFGTGNDLRMQPYNDVNSLFGMGAGIENAGYTPFNMGSKLGTNALSGDAAMANMMGMGANARYETGAANTGMFTDLIGAGFEFGGSKGWW